MGKAQLSAPLHSPTELPSAGARRRSSQDALWRRYLINVEQPAGALSPPAARGLKTLWRYLRTATNGRFTVPRAAPTQDHGIILSWEKVDHYLEIEIFDDGRYDWFYREEETGEYVSGEDRRPEVPEHSLERYAGLFS